MAARRLIALLIVLLTFSVVLAALGPTTGENELASTTTATTTAKDTAPSGRTADTVELTISASEPELGPIELEVGDRLVLTVEVDEPGPVVTRGLGLREFAEPLAPASFDLLATRPGEFDVVIEKGTAGEPRRLTTIVVAEP